MHLRLAELLDRTLEVHHVATRQELLQILHNFELERLLIHGFRGAILTVLTILALMVSPVCFFVYRGGRVDAILVLLVLLRVIVRVVLVEVVLAIPRRSYQPFPEPFGPDALLYLLRVVVVLVVAAATALSVSRLRVRNRNEAVQALDFVARAL